MADRADVDGRGEFDWATGVVHSSPYKKKAELNSINIPSFPNWAVQRSPI